MEEGREGERERGRKGGREGEREEGMEEGREGERERGRKGGKKRRIGPVYNPEPYNSSTWFDRSGNL